VVDRISISRLRQAIRRLPADDPVVDPKKWYTTQKQHWIGWLGEYHGPGFYGRKAGSRRDAEFAYNHIVEPKMLLWLVAAVGVESALVERARRSAQRSSTLAGKAAAVRRHVPWSVIAANLWPQSGRTVRRRKD
jgi:hypothetical protein